MVFTVVIVVALVLDLLVLGRGKEATSLKQATVQTLLWMTLGLAFAAGLALTGFGAENVQQYLAGYVVEYSLSVDNVFVWSFIIGFFAVPKVSQHAVLFWGIMCAVVLRFVFVLAGVTVINRFEWMMVVMGAFLVWTGIGLALSDDNPKDVSEMFAYRVLARCLPVARGWRGTKFFVREGGKLKVTVLLLCAMVIGLVDIVFAIDSVPAVLAISRDPFIVFSSNAMAIMGLRSLYFLFDRVKSKFTRLDEGLAVILAGVGAKMILGYFLPEYEPPTWVSLVFIATVLLGSVAASRVWPETSKKEGDGIPS